MTEKKFPDGFYWGAATASYQVEGGIYNTDWAKAATEGRVPECGEACDHYNRYEADFDIAKSLGHTAHRLSIEWSRKDFPEVFARYAAYVVKELKDETEHFSTLNEPYSVIINGWLQGEFPPFRRFSLLNFLKVRGDDVDGKKTKNDWLAPIKFFTLANVLARAHNLAYKSIKQVSPQTQVSIVFQIHAINAVGGLYSKIVSYLENWHRNHRFLKKVYKQCDVLGINYYFSTDVGGSKVYPKTDMGWDSRPEGIYQALMMAKRYQKPIFVAEAGCADEKDAFRAEYITKTVRGIHQAITDGVQVKGYMYWSLLDNYEWAHGFSKRFGLVEINYETQERTIRPSAYVYKKICEQNTVLE